jgi:hypothetical protein
MDQSSVLRSLRQIDSSETGRVFREFLRGQVRESLVSTMAAEVRELCGPKYHPTRDPIVAVPARRRALCLSKAVERRSCIRASGEPTSKARATGCVLFLLSFRFAGGF